MAEQPALRLGEPKRFCTAPGYETWPLVLLRLETVDEEQLTGLVTDAWQMRRDPPLSPSTEPVHSSLRRLGRARRERAARGAQPVEHGALHRRVRPGQRQEGSAGTAGPGLVLLGAAWTRRLAP